MEIALTELEIGMKAKIISIKEKGPFNRRIRDMGINPGAEVIVEKIAPLGDPINIKVKNLSLALRKSEALKIMVEKIEK